MIASVTIENFKAFSAPQTLHLRRVNTIFGANSAGKSSLIHALLLGRHIFQTGEFDAREIADGIDLGGFNSFVYGKDASREVGLQFKLEPSQGIFSNHLKMEPIGIKLSIGCRDNHTELKKVSYEYGKSDFVELSPSRHSTQWLSVASINFESPLIEKVFLEFVKHAAEILDRPINERLRSGVASLLKTVFGDMALIESRALFTKSQRQAAERRAERWPGRAMSRGIIPLAGFAPGGRLRRIQTTMLQQWLIQYQEGVRALIGSAKYDAFGAWVDPKFRSEILRYRRRHGMSERHVAELFPPDPILMDFAQSLGHLIELARLLTAQLVETLISLQSFITEEFEGLTHLGPLRVHPEGAIKVSSGAKTGGRNEVNGETAWLRLAEDQHLRDQVNQSLERLGMHYQVGLRALYDRESMMTLLDAAGSRQQKYGLLEKLVPSHQELLLRDTRAGIEVGAREVGVGVSQVLPVLVGTFGSDPGSLTSIEQPELHLHPALQAELADVFVEAANAGRTVILETHSEHLLLRLLRRIRNTTEQKIEREFLDFSMRDINVVFVRGSESGSMIDSLQITADGDLEGRWPRGFFADRSVDLIG